MEDNITIIATATMGVETLVRREIETLGYDQLRVENGKVEVDTTLDAIPRLNLWLRTADRIKIKVDSFIAHSFEELFEQTKAIPWEMYIGKKDAFPVIGRSVKSTLYSVPDCQRIVKKAIVERLKQSYDVDWFEETGAMYKVEVAIHKDVVTLSIDATGDGLHKRGYRALHSRAPLKETLAAAMIMLTNWKPDMPFVDPFCGSGTIPIEAAMIGQNIAPGFNRSFVSESWPWIGEQRWEKAREEAEDVASYDTPLEILGTDIDHRMIELSENNTKEAGLYGAISFKQMQVADFTTKHEVGTIVTNPPYGTRLSEKKDIKTLYQTMGKVFRPLDFWSVYVLTSHESFESLYGKKATKKRKLYNGNMKTYYYQFWGKRPPKPHQ